MKPRLNTSQGFPDYYVISSLCPYCGVRLDGAAPTDMQLHAPVPGDLSCCIKCGGVMVFDDNLTLVVMTSELWSSLDEDFRQVMTKLSERIRSKHGTR